MTAAADIERHKHICWQAGVLDWKLFPHQDELSQAFALSSARKFVVRCARRFGKSYWCCVEAVQQCIRREGAQVRYAAPTAKMVRSIIEPHMRDILLDAPAEMRPTYRRQEGMWEFPNGSQMWVAGCDNSGYERLRGTDTDLGIVDEAGFVDELRKVVDDVLLPQTVTRDGRLLIASTPPRTPDHDFITYDTEAQRNGAHVHRTIHDATHVTEKQIEEYARESGGEETTTWRREYLAEIVVEETDAVVPEFHRHKEEICQAVVRPHFYDTYVSIDFGYQDLTFAVFGYWHFPEATLVVEDELVWQHTNSQRIVEDCLEKEKVLWGLDREAEDPNEWVFRRVADAPELLLADIVNVHGYRVSPTRKDDKEAQINELRLAVAGSGRFKLRIHPRCVALRAHLETAIWDKSRKHFARSRDHGHFDGVDALLYLCRNVSRTKNPYPRYWQGENPDEYHLPVDQGPDDATAQTVRDMFARRKR